MKSTPLTMIEDGKAAVQPLVKYHLTAAPALSQKQHHARQAATESATLPHESCKTKSEMISNDISTLLEQGYNRWQLQRSHPAPPPSYHPLPLPGDTRRQRAAALVLHRSLRHVVLPPEILDAKKHTPKATSPSYKKNSWKPLKPWRQSLIQTAFSYLSVFPSRTRKKQKHTLHITYLVHSTSRGISSVPDTLKPQ